MIHGDIVPGQKAEWRKHQEPSRLFQFYAAVMSQSSRCCGCSSLAIVTKQQHALSCANLLAYCHMHSCTHWGGKVPSGYRIQVYYSVILQADLTTLMCVSPLVRYSRRRGQPWGPLRKEQSRLCWRSRQEAPRPCVAPGLLRTHEQMYREIYQTFWVECDFPQSHNSRNMPVLRRLSRGTESKSRLFIRVIG